MDPVEYHGASYVAAYLGTSLTSIHNWRNEPGSGFPSPVISITGVAGNNAAFGWHKEQLPGLRAWFAQRMKFDEATTEARWKAIDSSSLTLHRKNLQSAVHPEQGMFTLNAPEETAA